MEGFEAFVSKRASAFRLTPPRPVKVERVPDEELEGLFVRLVGPQTEGVKTSAEKVVFAELQCRFSDAGVRDKLRERVTVRVRV